MFTSMFTQATLFHLVIAVGLAVHAMKTGRSQWWLFILLLVPLIGSIAYVVIELIPAMVRSHEARKVATNIHAVLDPDKEWRERVKQAELVDSVDAKRALAEECEKKGLWADAIRLYQAAATGIFADDPAVLTGLARAQLGAGDATAALETLHRLEEAQPHPLTQDSHLLLARALEATGRTDEALAEYDDVTRYFAGFEARARYGLLLLKQGRVSEARDLFIEIVRSSSAKPVAMAPGDKEWIRIAKANLR